jgi:sugar lactone lactonase YvrE
VSLTVATDTLLDGGGLFECPRWHDGAWWVSDIYAQHVLRVGEEGTATTVASFEDDARPSGLGWLPNGDLLVVLNNRRQLVRIDGEGRRSVHADDAARLDTHGNFNDMVVAPDGRAFVSNMGHGNVGLTRSGVPAPTCITVIEPDGRIHDEGSDLNFPNGMVLTSDTRTLIVSETGGRRLTAFCVADDGALSEKRIWADLAPVDHWPDGCCLDAQGAIWTASPRGRTGWLRVGEGGRVFDRLPAPPRTGAYACALSHADPPTLLLCARRELNGRSPARARASMLLTASAPFGGAGRP